MVVSRKHSYWIAPFITATVLLSVYAFYSLYPFGNGTVAWCDMKQQVIPFLLDLKNILTGKSDLFLNLANAGSMDFWGVFLFFLSSPFSFLVVLIPSEKIYLFVNILLLLKMMTCALTAAVWFCHCFSNLDVIQASAVSVMYSFCGYVMFYYQNIVWLDVMALFPLLLIGLGKLIHEKKPLAYTFLLAAVLTVNFYLTYMVAIFLILGFGLYIFLCIPKEQRKEQVLLFGISTIVSGLLTGVVWLPAFLQYTTSARVGELITGLRTGRLVTDCYTTTPVIFCSGAILATILFLLFQRRGKGAREKWFCWMLFLTLIPIFVEPINKMWQTGSYQSFPVRYGYIPILLGLTLFAGCVSKFNQEVWHLPNRREQLLPAAVSAGTVVVVALCTAVLLKYDFGILSYYTHSLWVDSREYRLLLVFAITIALAYLLLMLQYHYGLLMRKTFSMLLCVLVVVESVFNSNVYIATAKSSGKSYDQVFDLAGKIQDQSIYRVKLDKKFFDVNLIGSLGYDSMSHYTSLTSSDYLFAMKKLGYSSYWMEVGSNGGTKLTDAVLANRYKIVLSGGGLPKEENYVYSNQMFAIARNGDAFPFGFAFRANQISKLETLPDATRFQMQQYLFQSLFSTGENLFTQYQPSSMDNVDFTKTDYYELTIPDKSQKGTILYKIPISGSKTLYFDCFDALTNNLNEHINSSFSVCVNDKSIDKDYPSQQSNGLLCLGTFKDETVEIKISVLQDVYAKSFGIASLNDQTLTSAMKHVSLASLRQSGNSIIGTVTADADGEYLFLPISYAKGFTAQVNGKPAGVYRVFDSFLAVRLSKGQNNVSVTYVPAGFRPGLIISLLGILCAVLLSRAAKRRKFAKQKKLQNVFTILFAVMLVFVFAWVYIFPLVIFFT